ncbi:family 43 glycosylhydrolase [Pontiellaceae bacterium B12219]|nr:family 43 glycosylhydrolase [Pontiellaceae bacterium B12219]
MKCKSLVLAALFVAGISSVQAELRRSNPIVSHMFTADPSAHVWDGRLYVYPSSDTSPPTSHASMDGYHVFSTDDMITWVDHGQILHSDDVDWGRSSGGYMWAPDCAHRNGTYYFYYPHKDPSGVWQVGVATSTNAASDFVDQGYVDGGRGFCDPCVFIDDDDQAYLYAVSNATCYAAELADNLMEVEMDMAMQSGLDGLREGPFVFKRNDTYYMIYPDGTSGANQMRYATSSDPLGPWTYQEVFLGSTDVHTTHGSCVEFNGQWYLFYHNGNLSGGMDYNRSICFDPIYFNADGSISMVEQSIGVELPTFHKDVNYNGMFGTLEAGDYTTADLVSNGISNNAISSLEIPDGYVVDCYEDDLFQGTRWRFDHSYIDLGVLGCDDRFSSIKISQTNDANLVTNGSFELGAELTISWWDNNRKASNLRRVLDDPDAGYYALRYQDDQEATGLTQDITIQPDTYYEVKASLKVDAGTIGQVFLEAGADVRFELDAAGSAGQWVEFSGVFYSEELESLTLSLGTTSDFDGTCYWDAIFLSEYEVTAGADAEPLMGAYAASVFDGSIQAELGIGDTNGVYLQVVPYGSYAHQQGFETDDLIRTINGTNITDKLSFWTVYKTIASGATVPVDVWRSGALLSMTFTKTEETEQLNDTAGVTYSGSWSVEEDNNCFNKDVYSTIIMGDSFEVNFYGNGVSFQAIKGSDRGNVDVYIDGVFQETASCYSATPVYQETVYKTVGLDEGIHTLRVVNADAKPFALDSFYVGLFSPLNYQVSTSQSDSTAPAVSSTDLAQTYYLSSSATGGNGVATDHVELFNGLVGSSANDTDEDGVVTMGSDNTVTVTFDTSVNTLGYNITGITTVFGWAINSDGRSNQGYELILTMMDDSVVTLAGPEHWEPNSPASYWTTVSFVPEGSQTIMASGVKAVTFNITEEANAGGVVIGREFDVFGYPVTEPVDLPDPGEDGLSFYVSPTGDDANEGSSSAPFQTLEQAKSAVRDALTTAAEPIQVWVEGGTYYLSEPLEFGPLDSGSETVPVTYSGISNETVVISGAVVLDTSWSTYSGDIMVADVGTGHAFDVLFAGGDQQVMARYPNYNSLTTVLNGYTSESNLMERATSWSNPTTGFVRALHVKEWGGQSYKITGVESDGSLNLDWVGDNNRGSSWNSEYMMVENLFEELDAPGEWFYDEPAGKLYFYPPADMDASAVALEAATAEELIRVVGDDSTKVKYLTFNNFTFTQTHRTLFTQPYEPLLRSDWCITRSGAVYLEQAENITVSNSIFENVGGDAIFMSGYNRDHLITWNEFREIGATCVNIVGLVDAVRYPSFWDDHKTDIADTTPGPQTEDYPKDITVSYNHMFNMGRFEKQTSGVNLSMSESITVSHNTIHKSPRSGLNVCDGTWGGHLFEYNDVFDCVRETGDHGPFNSWGRDRFWSYLGYDTYGGEGSAKRPYAFLDAWKTTIIRNNRFHYAEPTAFGIDLDDGSSNYEIYNNLLMNTSIKLREGFDRKAYNNIMINRPMDLHVWFDECRDVITNNITVNSSAYSIIRFDETTMSNKQATADYNLFYNDGNSVSVTWLNWDGYDLDDNSLIADPLFVDTSAKDYSVASGSPALGLGFVNFPMDQFGKPGAPEPGPIDGSVIDSPDADPEPLMGAEACSVWDASVQSALGAADLNGVYLRTVPDSSYAATQGFDDGDLILSINGTTIANKQSFWLLYHAIEPGEEVAMTYMRNQLDYSGTFIKPTTSEELNNTAGLVFSGAWTNQANTDSFNGDIAVNSEAGAYFEVTFYGVGISFTSQKNSDMGDIVVYIDDELDQTISCYNGSRLHQQTVYTSAALDAGIHTMRAVNAGNFVQMIDSFTIDNNDSPIVYTVSGSDSEPTCSTNDLAQTYYLSSSATGGNQVATEHADLFNGQVGNMDDDTTDAGEVTMDEGNTFTVQFDTSVHSNGYSITGIDSCFGWGTESDGRSNQGYEIRLTYVDGTTISLMGPEHWAPNTPTVSYFTTVSFSERSGGIMAEGVKAVTFDISHEANAGGVVVGREIDIFGYPTAASFSSNALPVAMWSLDDGEGFVVLDHSGNGYDGIHTNGVWVEALNGGALEFNGSDTRVSIPSEAFDSISDELSIAMWVYGGTSLPKKNSIFLALDSDGARQLNIHLPWTNSNVYWDAGNSGSGADRINKPASIDEFKGRWKHWVFTKNANSGVMNVYLNGSLWHSGSGLTTPIGEVATASFGAGIATDYYSGMIASVQLYDQALSGGNVSELYAEEHIESIGLGLMTSNGVVSVQVDGIAGETYVIEQSTNLVDETGWITYTNLSDAAYESSVTLPATNKAGYFRLRWIDE